MIGVHAGMLINQVKIMISVQTLSYPSLFLLSPYIDCCVKVKCLQTCLILCPARCRVRDYIINIRGAVYSNIAVVVLMVRCCHS